LVALVGLVAHPACTHPTPVGVGSGAGGGSGATTGSGATGGSGGGVARDGGGVDAGPSRGPTPARAGHNFPFPQNRMSAGCFYPAGYLNSDVQAAYDQWKRDTVTSDGAGGNLRVKRPHEPVLDPNTTVSEGIGYGMIIAVFMDDQALFDGLWKYEQLHLEDNSSGTGNGLMDWYISADGTMVLGMNGATDADEDMAFALLMADKQWGGQGTLDKPYIQHATDQITKIWNHEILDSKLAGAGDHFLDWHNINISYFAPAYYRLFKSVNVSGADWDAVINTAYDTIEIALNNDPTHQMNNGLVPAWCSANGTPPSGVCSPVPAPGASNNSNYQYDSCRTPFRIALDWCWFGEPRAKAYLAKTSAFFSGIGAKQIVDGYGLDGTAQPSFAMPGGAQSAAFVGPAGVGAMSDVAYQTFVNQAYADVATRQLLAGGTYYDESWTVMSLLMMTGNFLNYTAPPN
jgi:endo-1,4-beta-D-glucanase Y